MTYLTGERVPLYLDLLPANITPLPDGVPADAVKRIVVTERMLTILWPSPTGGPPPRVDIEMTPEDTAEVGWNGGLVGGYTVSQGKGCGCRGGGALRSVEVFPNIVVLRQVRPGVTVPYGTIPPRRYTRL